jgi:hypothetical protein
VVGDVFDELSGMEVSVEVGVAEEMPEAEETSVAGEVPEGEEEPDGREVPVGRGVSEAEARSVEVTTSIVALAVGVCGNVPMLVTATGVTMTATTTPVTVSSIAAIGRTGLSRFAGDCEAVTSSAGACSVV